MRILALIAARGGSKRIPGKNLRLLGGRPLVRWTIDAACAVAEVCDVMVSTDDPAIAAVTRSDRVRVPWLRPDHLATDTATAVDVTLHALDWYESERGPVDGILLLQPTSPFRSAHTIRRGIAIFQTHDRRPVVAVAPVTDHPLWTFRVERGELVPFVDGGAMQSRSQDLPPAYVISGALYLIAPADLRERRSFSGPNVVPLIVDDPMERLDIDTPWDLLLAEAILSVRADASTDPSRG